LAKETIILDEWNESYDYKINLDRSEFLISGERRRCKYEKWKEIITLSHGGNTQRRVKSFDTAKGS